MSDIGLNNHHNSPPPGYITATEAAKFLGLSRQSFYHRGIAEMMPRWKVGSVVLYREDDVKAMDEWMKFIRPAFITFGLISKNAPLRPSSFDPMWWWELATECPECGSHAVEHPGEPDTVWCPKCGVVNPFNQGVKK